MIHESQVQTGGVPFVGADAPSDAIINTCVHCGLCLSSCPTYRETGLESASPRGRIYLIKAVSDGRIGMDSEVFQEQMSLCLNCRACEAVCPSGVQYGQLLETARTQIERARAAGDLAPHPLLVRFARRGAFGLLFKHLSLLRGLSRLLRLYQRSGVQTLVRRSGLLALLKLQEMEALLPQISDQLVVPIGQIARADGQPRAHVALLSGCIMATSFAAVHQATIRVLQKNGCEVLLPPDQGCCGALHIHGGDMQSGRELARRNIAAFEALGIDAIIVNAAGCGSTLKEYGHLLADDPAWAERARAFSAKVKDICEFLASLPLNTQHLRPLNLTVTYQEPCHLAHAQRITTQPRQLLLSIPGLTLKEMRESAMCCGSAGIYNLTQPEMSAQLAARKLDHAEATGAHVVVTANPGCQIQLESGLRKRNSPLRVAHIVELLDQSYGAA